MAGSRRVAAKKARAAARSTAHAAIAKRAIGYVRVSTEEQASTGHGLEIQAKAIRAFAESQSYELVEIIEEPGVSGASVPRERPGFSRLLELGEAGAFSVILVWKFDRLARHTRFAVTTIHELNELNLELRSVTESAIETGSPVGRMLFALLAAMSEGERDTIIARTWSGRRETAQSGRLAGGTAPFGYTIADGQLEVVEAEAPIVRLMFALREDGLILRDIADQLNAAGHMTRQGKIWRPGTVAYVLDNPRYRGELEYLFDHDGSETHVVTPGAHEAIV